MVDIPDIYDRLATKYKFLLDNMEVISEEASSMQKELKELIAKAGNLQIRFKELQKTITNTILEVTTG